MRKNRSDSISNRDELNHIQSLIAEYSKKYPRKVIRNLRKIGWTDTKIANEAFGTSRQNLQKQFGEGK